MWKKTFGAWLNFVINLTVLILPFVPFLEVAAVIETICVAIPAEKKVCASGL